MMGRIELRRKEKSSKTSNKNKRTVLSHESRNKESLWIKKRANLTTM